MNQHPASSNNNCSRAIATASAQRGVGLIEILIAVLVLSIGILGIALLQAKALTDNGSSMSQTAATSAAYSILDAMRVDRINALAGSYNTTVSTSSCPASAGNLAAYQLNRWCANQLAALLGVDTSTQGIINCTSVGLCTITVQYDDSKATGGSTTTGQTTLQKISIKAAI